eukprot:scaffold11398_cov108-Isochrysis_galbana.AAC.6
MFSALGRMTGHRRIKKTAGPTVPKKRTARADRARKKTGRTAATNIHGGRPLGAKTLCAGDGGALLPLLTPRGHLTTHTPHGLSKAPERYLRPVV